MTSELRQQLAGDTLHLLEIPSETGNEKAICDDLEVWAKGLPNRPEVRRLGNSLVVGAPDADKPSIVLTGHIDTLRTKNADVTPRMDDERIFGSGANDMKGSLAIMKALAEQLDTTKTAVSVTYLFYEKEQGPYDESGLQPILDSIGWMHEVDLAIALEPTDGTVQLGCMGSVHATVTFAGKTAHAARPWEGDNAIHAAAGFLNKVAAHAPRDQLVQGLVFRESMSITLAQGGDTRYSVPSTFSANLNVRFAPVGHPQEAVEQTLQNIRRLAPGADVSVVDVAPPGPVPVHNPLVDHFRAVVDREVKAKNAWTDVARFASLGVDALNFGPGSGAQALQNDESIEISSLVDAYHDLHRFLTTPLST